MCCTGVLRTTCLFAILLALVAPGFSQGPAERPLTNADVVRMLNAGVPENVVVSKIRVSENTFLTTPDALIGLKRHNVPDGVLEAIVDSQAPARGPGIEAPGVQFAGGSPFTQHHHNLPNVDASFHLDRKTTGKLQLRKNEIKLEKAGVPLFSVKWKENPSK